MSLPTSVERSRKMLTIIIWVSIVCMLAGVVTFVVSGFLEGAGWVRVTALVLTLGGLATPFVAALAAGQVQQEVPDEEVVPDGEDLVLTDEDIEATKHLKVTD